MHAEAHIKREANNKVIFINKHMYVLKEQINTLKVELLDRHDVIEVDAKLISKFQHKNHTNHVFVPQTS